MLCFWAVWEGRRKSDFFGTPLTDLESGLEFTLDEAFLNSLLLLTTHLDDIYSHVIHMYD